MVPTHLSYSLTVIQLYNYILPLIPYLLLNHFHF